ncbi:pancreatic triacylglycerol lipase-like [Choristoneura fumiferana]|uniref:pancreatic triacylglycerol lipase-like n=1 Tax=Choristoneura fumiferana TaxID=7141 RepID=UPI003D15924B
MSSRFLWVFLSGAVLFYCEVRSQRTWVTTDELENHISPDDLRAFVRAYNESLATTVKPHSVYISAEDEFATSHTVPDSVDCFGLGSLTKQLSWLFNMRPDSSDAVNTHFFFYSRQQPYRCQVLPGQQFGLEWVDFKPNRRTIMIVHGFMSHSNASWVHDMALSFLKWEDVNVLTVDWSGGGNTWKYWRAVANTRRVGSDVVQFLKRLIALTGARMSDFHFIGHSLGAHICSFVSFHLGGVSRITGLDPAQPCFRTSDISERLDKSDADFVDVIHTNGRLLKKIGFGLPEPTGHADFYPNGGMQQPGCHDNGTKSLWSSFVPFPSQLQQAICSHGRAYLLFTESLINNNCSFRAYRWNLSYEGVNDSLKASCDRIGSCSEMGIKACGGGAMPGALGPYFVLTTEKVPYCPTEAERQRPAQHLLKDLREGFQLLRPPRPRSTRAPDYADPDPDPDPTSRDTIHSTTKSSWLVWWRG